MSQSTTKAVGDTPAPRAGASPATVALGVSLAAVVAWIAGWAADELYLVMAAVAAAGLVLGVRARRALGPEAPGAGRAIAAIVVSGVLLALFLAFLGVAIATGDL